MSARSVIAATDPLVEFGAPSRLPDRAWNPLGARTVKRACESPDCKHCTNCGHKAEYHHGGKCVFDGCHGYEEREQ